jgi:hypothetical protein
LWGIILGKEKNGVPKTGSSVQYVWSFGFVSIAMLNVTLKKFFASVNVTGTQAGYSEYPVKGYGIALLA